MLNADGGTLAFGLSDEGTIQNVASVADIEKYKNIAIDLIVPTPHIETEEVSNFDFDDLDGELLKRYQKQLHYEGKVLDLLVKRHLATKNKGKFTLKTRLFCYFQKILKNTSPRHLSAISAIMEIRTW